MKVLVTGGRDYSDSSRVSKTLGELEITALCNGGARGADTLCRMYAQAVGIPVTTMPADWNTHGRAAGHIRNQAMLIEFAPDVLVAFPGGVGTKDMVRRAIKAGVRVLYAEGYNA